MASSGNPELSSPELSKPQTVTLERVIEPYALSALQQVGQPVVVIDLAKRSVSQQVRVPRSRWLDARQLIAADPERHAQGLLPSVSTLAALMGGLGLTPESSVVASDDEGRAWASRLLWTLELLGHRGSLSLLNGGIHAWIASELPTEQGDWVKPTSAHYDLPASLGPYRVSAHDIKHLLDTGDAQRETTLQLWDTRSREEYTGERQLARRGGHIPSAIWLEWSELIDRDDALRLRKRDQIEQRLHDQGITADSHLIVYCQSHHRSSLAYWVARWLGREVRAYDGSWSEWGNRHDLPVCSGDHP